MKIIGIAIGGTKTTVSLASFENRSLDIIDSSTFPTNPNSEEEIIQGIKAAIALFNSNFDYISIICGGPLDVKKGTINKPPHLPGLDGTNIVSIFKETYHVPVSLLNDADACALAEKYFGAGVNSHNFAFVTFGTGIGSGLILNDKLYTGNNGMAGEFGHVKLTEDGPIGYGKQGSVEGWCAGGNIPGWTAIKGINTTKELFENARKGDEECLKAVYRIADKLAESLSILIDILNLDSIIIGGIYFRNVDLLETPLKKSLSKYTIAFNLDNCKILPSKLGDKIDLYSSLAGFLLENNYE